VLIRANQKRIERMTENISFSYKKNKTRDESVNQQSKEEKNQLDVSADASTTVRPTILRI
jgi:hypothetical protein